MKRLTLDALFIGNTDAKNELLTGSSQEVSSFKNGFLMPDNVVLEHFYSGKKYYITGLKGTGKTALLRYLSICVEEHLKAKSSFILFKTDVREEDRARIVHIADIISKNESIIGQYKDYERAWMLFLFQQIVKLSNKKEIHPFKDDSTWKQFSRYVLSTLNDSKKNGLFPKLKNGNIEIDASILKVGVDFEWSSDDVEKTGKKTVDFIRLVSDCEDLFSSLKAGTDKLYVFIDELEISLGTEKQYKRDVEMIRDLILSINRINTISRQNSLPLFIITGIRKEVLAVTQSTGKEINKPIADFGINLRWQQSGGSMSDHPLIKIIIKRLINAETSLPMIDRASADTIWDKYFPLTINEKPTYEFLLNKTWYRPRDIVRLLGLAREQFPHSTTFSHSIFDAINKQYSTDCWLEQEEELRAKYSVDDIKGIKHILMGIKCPFTLETIFEKASRARTMYSDVDQLFSKVKLADILEHLFRVGIIGNTGKNSVRYSFRGDEGLIIDKKMTIHPALWNVLSITK